MRLRNLKNASEESKELSRSPGTLFTEDPFCPLSDSVRAQFIYNASKPGGPS